ncbi:MAG: GGDEF domain-containing protein [Treponemataceae bacterium]
MKNNSMTTLAIVFLAIFLCIFAYISVSVILQIKTGSVEADQEFTYAIDSLRSLAGDHTFLSESYVEGLKSFLDKSPRIDAIVIEQGSEVKFAYPLQSKYIHSNYNREPEVGSNSLFVRVFDTRVSVKDPYDTRITAPVYILQSRTIFPLLKRTFFIVIIVTLIMFFIALFIDTEKKPAESVVYEGHGSRKVNPVDTSSKGPIIQNISYHSGNQPSDAPAPRYTADDQTFVAAGSTVTYDPMGLRSVNTGAGKNTYFEATLDSELMRSISNEQDLTLVLIQVNNVEHSHPCAKQIGNILVNTLHFANLLFEYSNSGYALLLKEMDLDHAISTCEHLYLEIESLLDENQLATKIAIGLSSRSKRGKLSASRLIYEANTALNKAQGNAQYPIIAFKVDTKKYNEIY